MDLTIWATERRSLQSRLLQSRREAAVRSEADGEKKALYLLRSILAKLQAFCEKTRNVHKELKDGILSALNAFKQVRAAHRRRLTFQAPKPCASVPMQVATTPTTEAEAPIYKNAGTKTPCWWPSKPRQQQPTKGQQLKQPMQHQSKKAIEATEIEADATATAVAAATGETTASRRVAEGRSPDQHGRPHIE